MTARALGLLGRAGLARGLSGQKGKGRRWLGREQRQRPRLAPGSHLKYLVKNVEALWSQRLRGPCGPADSPGEPVPLEEFSMLSAKRTNFSAPVSCWPFVVWKEGVGEE